MDGRPRLLVVEDNFLLAEVLCDFVADGGLQPVGPAGGLEKGLALAAEEALDGAILDINLAGRLCFPICEVLEQRDIPFCFVTGYSHLGLIPDRYQDIPVVAKPFEPQELRGVIDMMLRGRAGQTSLPGTASVGRVIRIVP